MVGESGCGKSTVALGVMQDLGVNGRIVGGTIKFKGRDLNQMSPMRNCAIFAASQIAMIYQEPMASLNPAMKIGQTADGSADDPRRGQRRKRPPHARWKWSPMCACPTPSGC